MDIIEFRKTHCIRPECLIFQACLWPEFKDGWPMGHPHHFPTPLHINDDGSLDAFAEDLIGIEYRAEPHLNGPFGPQGDLDGGFPSPCVLTLALPTGRPYQVERIQVLQEAEAILTPLAWNHTPCVIVGVCQTTVEYGHRFTRCHPTAIFSEDLKPLWVHPAALAFGLIDCKWPGHQTRRDLGEVKDWSTWGPAIPADYEDPATGLPAWYARSRAWPAFEAKAGFEKHGALLHTYGSLLHRVGEVDSIPSGFQRAHQEFQDAWGWIFGLRGVPGRGHPNAA